MTVTSDKYWDIWSEGYTATGQYACAHRMRIGVEAPTFQEACDKAFQHDKDYNSERLTHWGCKLYDNPADARLSFG